MATKAQIRANRKNAKKSTGPRTNEGKARSAQNPLKHGLLARDAVLPDEDPADFDRQLCDLEDTIEPKNALEFALVRQIADAEWRLRRLTRLETGYLAAARDKTHRHNKTVRHDDPPEGLRRPDPSPGPIAAGTQPGPAAPVPLQRTTEPQPYPRPQHDPAVAR